MIFQSWLPLLLLLPPLVKEPVELDDETAVAADFDSSSVPTVPAFDSVGSAARTPGLSREVALSSLIVFRSELPRIAPFPARPFPTEMMLFRPLPGLPRNEFRCFKAALRLRNGAGDAGNPPGPSCSAVKPGRSPDASPSVSARLDSRVAVTTRDSVIPGIIPGRFDSCCILAVTVGLVLGTRIASRLPPFRELEPREQPQRAQGRN